MQFLEDDIERRNDKEECHCSDRHSSGHADSERTVSVRTGSTLDNQRNHTGDHGHNGHQNRTQTIFASAHRCLQYRHSLLAFLHGKLGNQNRRLRQQSDQHDHTRLEVDIVLLAAKPRERERTHQTERNRQKHRQRNEIRFVERSQNHIDQQHADEVNERGHIGFAVRLQLAAHSAVFVAVTSRQMVFRHLVYHALHIAFAVTRIGLDEATDRLIQVESFLRCRSHGRGQRHELRNGRHLIAYAHEDIIERRRIQTVFRSRSCHHTIDLAVLVEIAYIRASAECAQRVEHYVRRDACAVALRRVHIYFVFGERFAVERLCDLHFRVFLQLREERIDYLVELTHVAALQILHLQVDTVVVSIARDLRHLSGEDLGVLDILAGIIQFRHHHVYIVLQPLTVVPWLETHDERTVAHACSGDDTETGDLGVTLHFLQPQHMFLHLRHDLVGLHQRRAGGSGHIDHEHTLVLLRNQTCRQSAHCQNHCHYGGNQPYPCATRFLDELTHAVFVFA